mmetsp:Transcript_29465/g.54060  ORF Transcript_29465/g.54060 Transcript_29465/m.54060 type:complete len:84 (-) Transcript_29465:284-535(-)
MKSTSDIQNIISLRLSVGVAKFNGALISLPVVVDGMQEQCRSNCRLYRNSMQLENWLHDRSLAVVQFNGITVGQGNAKVLWHC